MCRPPIVRRAIATHGVSCEELSQSITKLDSSRKFRLQWADGTRSVPATMPFTLHAAPCRIGYPEGRSSASPCLSLLETGRMKTTSFAIAVITAILLPCVIARGQTKEVAFEGHSLSEWIER